MCLRKFKIFYRKIFPGHRYSVVPRLLNDCDSVLDLGCGPISPLHFCNIIFSVGVDIFEPYLIQSKKKEIHNEYILSNVLDIEFRPKSFDAVVSLEILEHISKKDGYKLIEKMKKYARKKII
ncbi:class I SAM-dependent methyltransferase, partial [bacterium]|nr:class I SAM-dependent methyltransferase [bacterium]